MGYGRGMGFLLISREPTQWTPKTYGVLQSMGYQAYGL